MKNFVEDNNTKRDMEGIKKDIESLTSRLGSLKGHAIKDMADQMENLGNVLWSFKDKGMNIGKDSLAEICTSTQKHPGRNLMCAFLAGMIATWFLKK